VRRGAVIALVCMATLALAGGARALSVGADGHRRAQEDAAHQSYLYRQLADREAVLESQRRTYVERIRRLESQIREREQDIAVLRARLRGHDSPLVGERGDERTGR
jgi:septal ring factor EnvC (AmiA/AmiB activator)